MFFTARFQFFHEGIARISIPPSKFPIIPPEFAIWNAHTLGKRILFRHRQTRIKLGGASIFDPVQAVNSIPTPKEIQTDIHNCVQQLKEQLDRECDQGLLRVYVTVLPQNVEVTKLLLMSKGYSIVGFQANQDNPELMDVAFWILK